MLREYKQAIENFPLPLPKGEKFPSKPPGQISDEGDYEAGFGGSFASFYWRCEWMSSFLEAFNANNASGQTTALDELGKWRTIPWVQEHVVDDPDHPFQTAVVDTARLGDPKPMADFKSGSC